MDDAASGHADALEGGNHGGVAAANVEQGWQFKLHREFQLGFKQRLLALVVQLFQKVIQANFAHGAQLPVAMQARQPVAQFQQVGGAMLIEIHRVQAEGGEQAFVLLHQVPQPLPIFLVHPSTTMRRTPSSRLWARTCERSGSKSSKSRCVWVSISSTLRPRGYAA